MDKYILCESIHNPPLGKWHIRRLSKSGKHYGGGIDTPTLCGRTFTGWDLEYAILSHSKLRNICEKCVEIWEAEGRDG